MQVSILPQPPGLYVCALSSSVMSESFVTPWTVAHQAPPSMGFSRQEYWSGGAIAFSEYVHYPMWNRWPVQVWCMKQGTQSWFSGTTQRDRVGRKVGGRFRMRGHMYTYGWFMLMYGPNHHNKVKCVHAKSLQPCPILCDPTDYTAHQAPLSTWFSWQEYWSELLCPSPGDLPNPGIEPASLTSPALAGGFSTTSATWEAPYCKAIILKLN